MFCFWISNVVHLKNIAHLWYSKFLVMCNQFFLNKMTIFTNIAPSIFVMCDSLSWHVLFLNFKFSLSKKYCHFVIFENFAPHQTPFFLWKSPFSDASPPNFYIIHQLLSSKKYCHFVIFKNFVPTKRCFLLWKSPFSDASPPNFYILHQC